jgi:hypothetical protein
MSAKEDHQFEIKGHTFLQQSVAYDETGVHYFISESNWSIHTWTVTQVMPTTQNVQDIVIWWGNSCQFSYHMVQGLIHNIKQPAWQCCSLSSSHEIALQNITNTVLHMTDNYDNLKQPFLQCTDFTYFDHRWGNKADSSLMNGSTVSWTFYIFWWCQHQYRAMLVAKMCTSRYTKSGSLVILAGVRFL